MWDYLIVGSGLFGSVFAREMTDSGKRCLVIDRRKHAGGNVFCENMEGINVHKYGAHIFHTSDEKTWKYVNRFATFNNFVNSPIAFSQGKLYNLPFNMNTFYALWGVTTPEDAQEKIQAQVYPYRNITPSNLEEYALKTVGEEIYNRFIKYYTEKQWNRPANELPASIIKRIPLRFNFDNNYFQDRYQGIPIGGYNGLVKNLLEGIEVRLNLDFFENLDSMTTLANKIVFTGRIDQFYNYRFGHLEYRSLKFEHEIYQKANYQGNAVVNYTDASVDFTRKIEHKHFEFGCQPHTIVSKEFPVEASRNNEPYYPLHTLQNVRAYNKYQAKSKEDPNIIFGGRLGEYRYYDMHQTVASALTKARREILNF